MTNLTRRAFSAGLTALPFAQPANAALTPYALVPQGTSVGFTFVLSGIPQSGEMPINSADVDVDMRRLQNSRVSVVLNVADARTKLPFARGPMLSPSVLNAERFPEIRFTSTRIRLGPTGRISEGATITGDLTLRGITRPITLSADLFRPSGSAVDDLDRLSIRLTGAVNRHEFGASGYPDLVQDQVGLNINAEISRVT